MRFPREEEFLTEYQVINNWRNSVVNSDFIMTSIFLPLSVGIFTTYFLIEDPDYYLRWLFFSASSGLLFFWRLYALHIDKKIRAVYPRICWLEDKLSFKFTLEYLKSEWFREMNYNPSWIPSEQHLKKNEKESFIQIRFSRGHGLLNSFAFIIIYCEYFIFVLI